MRRIASASESGVLQVCWAKRYPAIIAELVRGGILSSCVRLTYFSHGHSHSHHRRGYDRGTYTRVVNQMHALTARPLYDPSREHQLVSLRETSKSFSSFSLSWPNSTHANRRRVVCTIGFCCIFFSSCLDLLGMDARCLRTLGSMHLLRIYHFSSRPHHGGTARPNQV